MLAAHRFSTDGKPISARPGLFRRQMARHFSVGLAVAPAHDADFHSSVHGYHCGRLHFATLRFSPHLTSAARLGPGATPFYLLSLQKEGVSTFAQDGRESRLEKDDIVLIDTARPFTIESGHILAHSVYIAPSALRTLTPHIDDLTACPIRGDSGTGGLLRTFLDELFAIAPNLHEDQADSLADAIPLMLCAALAPLRRSGDLMPARVKLAHKQRIRRFIHDHLADPGLDAQRIAAGVNLSRRYVHDLFSGEETSLMKAVWEERLERCRRELADMSLVGRTVSEIAFAWGFSDLAHFSRTFRQRFGAAPSLYRRGLS